METRLFGRSGMHLSRAGLRLRGGRRTDGARRSDRPGALHRRRYCAGVNYFDTAVLYGNGELEKNLGRVLHNLKASDVIIGTKVRLTSSEFGRIANAVATSLEGSLTRLRRDRIDIFHLHNEITEAGGGETLSFRQVLEDVVPAFERMQQQGKTRFSGLPPSATQ